MSSTSKSLCSISMKYLCCINTRNISSTLFLAKEKDLKAKRSAELKLEYKELYEAVNPKPQRKKLTKASTKKAKQKKTPNTTRNGEFVEFQRLSNDIFGKKLTENEILKWKQQLEANSDKSAANDEIVTSPQKDIILPELTLKQLEEIKNYPLSGEQLPLPDHYGSVKPIEDYLSGFGSKKPSVGKILKATMSEKSKAALERWEKEKIAELGIYQFNIYKQALFRNGSNFHACVAARLENKDDKIKVLPDNEGVWSSIQSTFDDVSDVNLVETRVHHPHLGYMGILDSVIRYRDELVLVDWKTADRQKDTLDAAYDDPIQIAAYMGALNSDPKFKLQVNQGLLVVAYRDGRPADVLPMKPVVAWSYWNQWLARLQLYWTKRLV